MPLVYFSLAWAKLNVFWLIIWKLQVEGGDPIEEQDLWNNCLIRPSFQELLAWALAILLTWSSCATPLVSPPRWGWMWCPPSHMPGGNGSTFCWRPRWEVCPCPGVSADLATRSAIICWPGRRACSSFLGARLALGLLRKLDVFVWLGPKWFGLDQMHLLLSYPKLNHLVWFSLA